MVSVYQYQMNLRHFGYYYKGKCDGIVGSQTKAAVKLFQKEYGLTQDGIYGTKTNAKLCACVRQLQKKVGVSQDAMVGTNTINAIKKWQKNHGIGADGIAGKITLRAMGIWKTPSSSSSSSSSSAYTSHFTRGEFRCGCRGKYCSGYPAEMQKGVINILEKLRSYYGKPITITSGVRCRTYNSTLSGSASNSMHLYGKAADFYIPGICDTAAGRNQVVQKCYAYGAKYAYCNTAGMGNAVHVNI